MERKTILDLTMEDYVEESSYEDYYSDESEDDFIDLHNNVISYTDPKFSMGDPQGRTFKWGSDSNLANLNITKKVIKPIYFEHIVSLKIW